VSFSTAAERFRLIDDADDSTVVVRYRPGPEDDTSESLIRVLETQGPDRWLMRRLQRCTVTIRRRDAQRLAATGALREILPGLFVQVADTLYDPVLGLLVDDPPPSPERLVL
jgi:CRISPR-associated endonuclease/helicase Cas3